MLIREKDKQALITIFQQHFQQHEVEVLAYGSRVNGTAHDASDLDLAIRSKGNTPIQPKIILELIETIRESNIPILVDIHNWDRLPDSFKVQIEKQNEILYTNKE
jgi:predicted nucleotidyltransferase